MMFGPTRSIAVPPVSGGARAEPGSLLARQSAARSSRQGAAAAAVAGSGGNGGRTGGSTRATASAAALRSENLLAQLQDEAGSADEGSRELLVRVRELAALRRQLEALQNSAATLQAAVSHADRIMRPDDMAAQETTPGAGLRSLHARRQAAVAEIASAVTDTADEEDDVHHVTCDGCGEGPPIAGQVMKCIDCEDFDLCQHCYDGLEQLGHPPGHRFRARTGRQDPEAGPQLLLRMLENTMLGEALRRSREAESDREAEAQEMAELRAAEVLSALPRVPWEAAEHGENSECALCLEEYKESEQVLRMPCGHLFHEGCIGPWFAKSLLCPLCQREVST